VQDGALLSGHDRVPPAVDIGEAPARRDALVAKRQTVLLGGDLAGDAQQCWGGAAAAARARGRSQGGDVGCGGPCRRLRSRRLDRRGRLCRCRGSGRAAGALGATRGEFGNSLFARGEIGGDLLALRRELAGAVGGVLLRFGERLALLMHRVPATHLAHQAAQTAEPARRSRHGGRRGIAFRGVVLLLHHLDALMQVAAGLQQIVVRFLYFVLRKFQLRLGQLEPVLEGSLVGIRSLGERGGEGA